jgi:hypothetical protein
MANTPKKDGTLFKASPATESSYETRLIYAIEKLEKPTSSNISEALGMNRKSVINRIQVLNKPYPEGYSMTITSSTIGYSIEDYGILDKRKLK